MALPRWVIGRRPARTLRRALLWAAIAYLVFGHALRFVVARGESMAPQVPDGAWRVADLVSYRFRAPRRGEVVTIRLVGVKTMLLKRVIGLPGEEVRFTGGVFYVNGEPLPEPYLVHRGRWTTGAYRLGPDEYYVAGDNREGAYTEHATGIVQRRDIVGRLLW